MTNDPFRIKREKDKVYISESSGAYAVLVGREKEPQIVFQTECVNAPHPDFPEDKSKIGGLWVILKKEKDIATQIENQYSSWKMQGAYQSAHDLALDYAESRVSLSKCIGAWPLVTPESQGPGRLPNHVTLTKIIDNSHMVPSLKNSELIEYTKERVSFEL
jgi:hypothetical protein